MNITVIVQARASSKRLPGKVLHSMNGTPMLGLLFERLQRSSVPAMVATSIETSDDPVATWCAKQGIDCVRGSLNNVAARFSLAVKTSSCDAFVRICGDSPLLDHRLVDQAVDIFRDTSPDLVTNVHPRSFPKGQSVEVVDTKVFAKICNRMSTPSHKEHVTSFFYEHAKDFHIKSFVAGDDWQDLQLSVDTIDDFDRLEKLLAGLKRPHWDYTWQELAELGMTINGDGSC